MATGTLVDVVMPQMGVSVSEGTITRWAKNVGEANRGRRDRLSRSRTDKVDTEVPAPGNRRPSASSWRPTKARPSREHPHRP
jgi:pyruvate/2-oxoglutarate dehydrogenase complex dihydrolipoamide acyltransferase (E2) component